MKKSSLLNSDKLLFCFLLYQDQVTNIICQFQRMLSIQENYAQPITLADLAEAALISPYYLCRQYKQHSGMTPFQYLIRYRMEVAMYYLRNTSETISQIASLVGYRSETHFQILFRKTVGITPGQYRSKS
jgi:iron complex transport system substrate-binding protein